MTQNETYLLPQMYYTNVSHFSSDHNQSFGTSYAVSLSASIIVATLSPIAAIGNFLVLTAIWRNPSLRTPSYILIAGLSFTDFSTGLITQPVYVANELIHLEDSAFKILSASRNFNIEMEAVTASCAVFFLLHIVADHDPYVHRAMAAYDSPIVGDGAQGPYHYSSNVAASNPISSISCTLLHYRNTDTYTRYLFCFNFSMLHSCHFCGLLQSFSNNSTPSTANPSERNVPQLWAILDRLF